MSFRHLLFSLLLASPLAAMAASATATPPAADAALERATAPIRSRAALAEYLAANHSASDPLRALSPAARERFVASLQFGPDGAASAITTDLQSELSAAQAYRVLALFGLQTALAGLPPLRVDSEDDRAVDAWRSGAAVPQYFLLNAVCTGVSWQCQSRYGGICWMPCPLF